ncbi:hypothetical protein P7C70_g8490, partial [Phenoliferia sp. Uapishka_3]
MSPLKKAPVWATHVPSVNKRTTSISTPPKKGKGTQSAILSSPAWISPSANTECPPYHKPVAEVKATKKAKKDLKNAKKEAGVMGQGDIAVPAAKPAVASSQAKATGAPKGRKRKVAGAPVDDEVSVDLQKPDQTSLGRKATNEALDGITNLSTRLLTFSHSPTDNQSYWDGCSLPKLQEHVVRLGLQEATAHMRPKGMKATDWKNLLGSVCQGAQHVRSVAESDARRAQAAADKAVADAQRGHRSDGEVTTDEEED